VSYSTGSSANRRSLSGPAAADRAGRVERRAPAALYGLFFLSGAAALAYEVLWMRGFAIFLGAAAPAAAAALAASFAGFGFGSYLLGRFAPRLRRPLRAFAILEISTGVSALAVDSLLRTAPPVLTWLSDVRWAQQSPSTFWLPQRRCCLIARTSRRTSNRLRRSRETARLVKR
jgi:hypothetical protein